MHLSCQKQAEKYLKGTILAILFLKTHLFKKPMGFFILKTHLKTRR